MEQERKHYSINITGRVQGVGFRYSAVNAARKFGISGYVKNNADGSVSLEIEGSPTQTDLMLDWCKAGPGTARVEDISVHKGNSKGYTTFEVRY